MSEIDRKKIVFVLPALVAGGAERVLITLMNGLDRDRYEPSLISVSAQGPLADMIDPAINFYTLSEDGKIPKNMWKLLRKLQELKPDVIVSTMAPMNFAVLVLRPLFPRTKFIVREAITPSYFFERGGLRAFLIRLLYKTLYPLAVRVISPARLIINEFETTLTMNTRKHRLLPNPVNMKQVRAQADENFKNHDAQRTVVNFVAAGRLHYQKGFDRVIKAALDLPRTVDWTLTILGEGEERRHLLKMIEAYNLKDRVKLPGLERNPWPFYAQADAFLLPSRSEGLPNVVLEALACGTPVIATREAGGIDDIAREAAPYTLTVVDTMEDFTKAMAQITPVPYPCFRPSLLPPVYELDSVVKQFSAMIEDLF